MDKSWFAAQIEAIMRNKLFALGIALIMASSVVMLVSYIPAHRAPAKVEVQEPFPDTDEPVMQGVTIEMHQGNEMYVIHANEFRVKDLKGFSN